MINKKNLLGKTPDTLGDKDAIHVAIVAVRAGKPINPGQRCGMNADREAVPDAKGCGVADPFRKSVITRGEVFWLLLNQDAVPNVQHVWEHPTIDFSAPTDPPKRNKTIAEAAADFGVTYEQVMDAAQKVADSCQATDYPGSLSREKFDEALSSFDRWDFWSWWAEETGYEFPEYGSTCCPETEYPDCALFEFQWSAKDKPTA